MARKFVDKSSKELEFILEDCAKRVGIEGLSEQKVALLFRLFISGISNYFFTHSNDSVKAGFIELHKNPAKEELFAVTIVRSETDGVVNADTLYKFYKGELTQEKQLKNIVNQFVENLLEYSQEEEASISTLKSKVDSVERLDEKERKKLINQKQWKARRREKLKNKKSSRQNKEKEN